MWLRQTWHQSSWSGFDFDKRKNFMVCKWSADWGTMNTALQNTALLDLMNFHFMSVDLGCVSVSRHVSFPLTCTSFLPLPPSVSPSWIVIGPHVPVSLFTLASCFLSAYWNFTCAFCSEKAVRQSVAPGGTRCFSSSIVSCVGTVKKTPASLQIEIWWENTMEARQ